ncbi:MAG: hypothetical protein IKA63_04840, partial [Clostridia bacterium]|nr:hypothetical protein [Clostridia bacterium]
SVAYASVSESPLSNTYKLLTTGEKKLTIGYLGGSITLGSSAAQNGGNISQSWVNRTSAWFQAQYPEATIETVNAGISDTATNFGLLRLEQTLMNADGHDMPDLVFVEFTTNDWIYETQTAEDLKRQAESLVRNIYAINPLVEIVIVSTVRKEDAASRLAYEAVGKHYHLPVVDVGIPLQKLMDGRGHAAESNGNFYYTVDNLHPSYRGYEVYFSEIEKELKKHLNGLQLKSERLYHYGANLPAAKFDGLWFKPALIAEDNMTVSGNAAKLSVPLYSSTYGTQLHPQTTPVVTTHWKVSGVAAVTADFSGAALGVIFGMNSSDIQLRYRIDGGAWQLFKVDKDNFSFQQYDHTQVFILAQGLEAKEHTVQISFVPTTSQSNIRFGGLFEGGM